MNKLMIPDEQLEGQEQPVDPNADLLQNAYDSQNKQELMANLLRSFQTAIQGSAPQSGFRADPSVANAMEKQASQPVELVKAQMAQQALKKKQTAEDEATAREKEKHDFFVKDAKMKLEAAEIKMEDTKLGDDPTSNISRTTQAIAKEWFKLSGKPYDEKSIDAMSGNQLVNIIPDLQKVGMEYLKEAQSKRTSDATAEQNRLRNELLKEQIRSREGLAKTAAEAKVEAAKAKAEEPSFKEKEKIKAEAKDEVQVNKENRKTRSELDKAEIAAQTTIDELKSARDQFRAYSKKSWLGGTGPIATLGGAKKALDADTEALQSKFEKLSLDEKVKMFAGMSKAIDTEAELAAFKATQPDVKNEDVVNEQIFADKIKAAESLLQKTKAAKERYDSSGSFNLPLASDFVMMQAPDGSPPVKVKKDQAQKYLDKGAKIVQPGQ